MRPPSAHGSVKTVRKTSEIGDKSKLPIGSWVIQAASDARSSVVDIKIKKGGDDGMQQSLERDEKVVNLTLNTIIRKHTPKYQEFDYDMSQGED